jgi:hypothetical protein
MTVTCELLDRQLFLDAVFALQPAALTGGVDGARR